MPKIAKILIATLVLGIFLGSATWASYAGLGFMTIGSGGPSARSNSVHGPMIIGGGPGHGK